MYLVHQNRNGYFDREDFQKLNVDNMIAGKQKSDKTFIRYKKLSPVNDHGGKLQIQIQIGTQIQKNVFLTCQ